MTGTKKIWIGVGIILVAALYIYVYADWFKSPDIQIFHRVTMSRVGRQKIRKQAVEPPHLTVAFGFDRKLKLTDVKVVPVAALATNKNALPVWHLVSQSNSVPVKALLYGERVRGMESAVKGALPQPLEKNATYRLVVKAGNQTGQHDFTFGRPSASD